MSKIPFNINVVHFTRENGANTEDRFAQLASSTKGEYSQMKGMQAIKSYVSDGE